MDKVKALKLKYNHFIDRNNKAEQALDKATDAEFNLWEPAFRKITNELSKMIFEYKELTGVGMTRKEILTGFDEVR